MQKQYPSKLMLFGEYAVIAGGEGLAIPWPDFFARWVEEKDTPSEYKQHLLRFAAWLEAEGFDASLEVAQLHNDLQNGLDMASNIPIGYGVGSSGAVVAAVYDRYARNPIPHTQLPALKQALASMENFFHATSSGLDPLVCYLQKPIHILGDTIHILENALPIELLHMHLLDCGHARSTHALVSSFRTRMQEPEFQHAMQEYVQLSNSCIHALLLGDSTTLCAQMRKLSAWQFAHFDFAIPQNLRAEWEDALVCGAHYYKLCGAGGGGFMLVCAPCS